MKTRKEEIKKAIKLIGWCETWDMLKTEEDKKLYNELGVEHDIISKERIDSILKKNKISL